MLYNSKRLYTNLGCESTGRLFAGSAKLFKILTPVYPGKGMNYEG